MARIRTIKPEFPHSESMGRVSRDARLTFIELWTIADDAGRLRGTSRMLASLLFPYDDDAPKLIDRWLGELSAQQCIIRYEAHGGTYIQIQNWEDHQKIDRPSSSKIPPFDECSRALDESSSEDLDQGPRTKEGIKGPKSARAKISLDELSVDHNSDWLAKKRSEGRYVDHDEHFVLEQFKQYCRAKGKNYADYLDAYRNAFEWDKCQPRKANNTKPTWKSEGDRLAAKYAAEAEREEQAAALDSPEPGMRIAEAIRQDSGGAGDAGGGILLGAG